MYIDGDTIIYWAKLIGAVAAIGGAAWAVVKIILRDKHQTEIIKGMQREQALICYGLRGDRPRGADDLPHLREIRKEGGRWKHG